MFLTVVVWRILWSILFPSQRWSCQMCPSPSKSTGHQLREGYDNPWQQAWVIQNAVMLFFMQTKKTPSESVLHNWGLQKTFYPVNHQKRILDRKEASFTGHGFWKRLKVMSPKLYHQVIIFLVEGFWKTQGTSEVAFNSWMMYVWSILFTGY